MRITFISILCFTIFSVNAQTLHSGSQDEFELAKAGFNNITDLGGAEIRSLEAKINVLKPLKNLVLNVGLGYGITEIDFNRTNVPFEVTGFNTIHNLRTTLSLIKPLKKKWVLIGSFSPTISSNLEKSIGSEDFIFNTAVMAIKKWKTKNHDATLRLGLLYGTPFGQPRTIPIISYQSQLNHRWSYSLGLPITELSYLFNSKHQLSFQLRPEGFFANNSGILTITNEEFIHTKLQYNGIRAGLNYVFRFAKNFEVDFSAGNILKSNLKIIDQGQNELFDFESENSPFLSLGLRYTIGK